MNGDHERDITSGKVDGGPSSKAVERVVTMPLMLGLYPTQVYALADATRFGCKRTHFYRVKDFSNSQFHAHLERILYCVSQTQNRVHVCLSMSVRHRML